MDTQRTLVGTSGFSYKDWLGSFYPQFCPSADFLRFYASIFETVEIDSTFYRIPSAETVTKWQRQTPDGFVFAAKFPRTVTHEGKLDERLRSAGVFIEVMRRLGGKLGPLLLQFPYGFKPDSDDLLLRLMDGMPGDIPISVELRNRKWLEREDILEAMRGRNMALCLIDHPWMPRLKVQTADFSYIRFLGDRKKIENDFSYVRNERTEDLGWWREALAELAGPGRRQYVYFNNHYSGHAPSTASRFLEMIQGRP